MNLYIDCNIKLHALFTGFFASFARNFIASWLTWALMGSNFFL